MPTKSPPNPSDEQFLDAVYARIFEQVEDGHRPLLEDFLSDRPHLKAEISKLIEIALEIAIAPSNHRPDLADFEIVSELGRGGMGAVYLARQLRAGGRLVALKILQQHAVPSEKARDRFVHEANTLAKLRHPNIVTLHDVILDHGVSAYAMEWIDGKPLSQLIERLRSFNNPTSQKGGTDSVSSDKSKSVRTPMNNVADFLGASADAIRESSYTIFICRILISIARALAEVHRLGLTHRDVKPSNILLRRDGTALLTDFGLVRQPDSAVVTQTGHFIGTLAYASPEQLHGDHSSVGPCSDGYSLGVTLYHALTLQLPFTGQSPAELLTQIEGGRSASLRRLCRDLPRDLETIVIKAMDPDPSRRYATTDELADDLECLLNLQPIKAKPATLVTRVFKAVKRNRASLMGAIVGSFLALSLTTFAGVYFLLFPRWAERHVSEARLSLLHPDQANQIYTIMFWNVPFEGKSVVSLESLQTALKRYDSAIRLKPWNLDAQQEREAVRLAMKEIAWRQTGKRSGIALGMSTPDRIATVSGELSLRSRGLLAFVVGDPVEALETWSRIDPLESADPLVEAAMGMLHLANSEPARSYPRLQNAVNSFPGVSFLTMYLADAALQCGDIDKAAKLIDRARREPFQDIQNGLGRLEADLLVAQGRDQEAETAYQKLLSPVALLNYARFLESRGRLEDSVSKYAAVSRAVPRSRNASLLFLNAIHAWWESMSPTSRFQAIRKCLEPEKSGRADLVALLNAYSIADRAISGLQPNAALEESMQESTSQRFSQTLRRSRSASNLQRDVVSLETLAGRMEVQNVERWNHLIKLPSLMKDWLAKSWVSPRPTLNGLFAEWCAETTAAILHCADACMHRYKTAFVFPIRMRPKVVVSPLVIATTSLAGPSQPYWAERCVTGPSARNAYHVAYDSARSVSVLFGGYDTTDLGDTWEWDGSSWLLRSSAGPSARNQHAMAYDSERNETILFGGVTEPSVFRGDTWAWDGTSWTLLANLGPSARYQHAMAFDSARGVTVVFGGADASATLQTDTWEWDGTQWLLRSNVGPSRNGAEMVYDSARERVVLFGGSNQPGTVNYNDTWEWDGTTWTQVATTGPSPRRAHGMAYDSMRGVAVLFGGWDGTESLNDTWEWDGTQWLEAIGPQPESRSFHMLVHDAARDRTIVFGGSGGSLLLGDTWERGVASNDDDFDLIVNNKDSCPQFYNPCQELTSPPTGFTGLGDLPGGSNYSRALALSADGTTVGGDSFSANCTSNYVGEPFRWRADTGIVGLGDLPGADFMGTGYGVSADGSVVTGWSSSGNGSGFLNTEAYRWTQVSGMIGLGDLAGGEFKSEGDGISDNGGMIVGNVADPDGYKGAYWTSEQGWTAIAPAGSVSYGISRSGEWLCGRGASGAFRWSQDTGYEEIGDLPGGGTLAFGQRVSDSGIVAGGGTSASGTEAFVWNPTDGIVGLGDLAGGGFASYANGISADGSIIVGEGTSGNGQEALMWDDTLTIHRVVDVLAANGVAIPCEWTLRSASDVTENCGVITLIGRATNANGDTEAWIASYVPGSQPIDPNTQCDDGNPCTDDLCAGASGCMNVNNSNTCDDNDSCTINDACTSGVCAGTPPRPWGDITPADCDPVVSGCNVVNIDDILCVLSSFAGNYTCAGGLANADIVPCAGNGVINLDDILGVLNAFTGANQCPCVP